MKLVRSSKHAKPGNPQKLSVLVQILSFLYKKYMHTTQVGFQWRKFNQISPFQNSPYLLPLWIAGNFKLLLPSSSCQASCLLQYRLYSQYQFDPNGTNASIASNIIHTSFEIHIQNYRMPYCCKHNILLGFSSTSHGGG